MINYALAKRLEQVVPSPTLAISAKAVQMRQAGFDVINLSVGEPDFDTPLPIKEAGIAAIEAGFTKYTAVDGIAELKQAIINKFKRDNNLDYQLNQIVVANGAKQIIYNLCQAILNAGDEVLIPAPYWVSYPDIVNLANGSPIIIPTKPQEHFKINLAQLVKFITPKTRLLILNSPSNPTGVAYTQEELHILGEALKQNPQILIASDDIYEYILWSQPFVNIVNACPELYDRTIVINGVSKAFAMTGWRIGYAAGPAKIIEAMTMIQSQSTSNPCSISQKAAVCALSLGKDKMLEMINVFSQRHQYIIERLAKIPAVEVIPADGTFYIFPNVQNIIDRKGFVSDLQFAEKLLQETGVALVPGSAFGQEGCIRISFATNMELLKEAMDRFEKFCQ